MSEQPRWTKEWRSGDLDLAHEDSGTATFAAWFNREYETCKVYLRLEAVRSGVHPDSLSYDVRVEQNRWDLRFIVTATEVAP